MIDVNLKGVLYGIAAALPHMKEQKSAHMINVSSVAGHKLFGGSAVHSATKFGACPVRCQPGPIWTKIELLESE